MGLFSMGFFALKAGEYSSARDLFAEGLRCAGGGYEEFFFKLGVSNLHLKNYPLGKACLEDVLQLNPNDQPSLQMLNGLNHK
jgi:tetratricopeptide (TPR) repeat protein